MVVTCASRAPSYGRFVYEHFLKIEDSRTAAEERLLAMLLFVRSSASQPQPQPAIVRPLSLGLSSERIYFPFCALISTRVGARWASLHD